MKRGFLTAIGGLSLLLGCNPNAQPPGNPQQAGTPGAQSGAATPAGDAAPEAAADLYGDQGGEQVLSVAEAPPGAPLRARKADTFYKLSNPRFDNTRPGLPVVVDYELVHAGEHGGVTVVYKATNGQEQHILILGPLGSKGTLELGQNLPTFSGQSFPPDAEVYFTRTEQRYGVKDQRTFKVSTSAVRGQVPKLTMARNWTAEEAALFRKPFPNFATANAHPNVGHDTQFAGDTTGGATFRFVDPQQPLLGIEYRLGAWDNEQCLGGIVPVFTRDQPITHEPRVIAKEGYAVGAMNFRNKRYINSVQLVFMKLTADGQQLDTKDSYTSDWIGYPEGGKETSLGGDGRRVIGIHARQGAILNGLALVMDKSGV